jgi:hypothetical protein
VTTALKRNETEVASEDSGGRRVARAGIERLRWTFLHGLADEDVVVTEEGPRDLARQGLEDVRQRFPHAIGQVFEEEPVI